MVDVSGNVYIAEFVRGRVRRVSPDGTIGTVAGGGSFRFSGDGGPATLAHLNTPLGIFVDQERTLFVADRSNLRIRAVAPDGIISTIAGSGDLGFPFETGRATEAPFFLPFGVSGDSMGNVYIAVR